MENIGGSKITGQNNQNVSYIYVSRRNTDFFRAAEETQFTQQNIEYGLSKSLAST